MFDRAEQIRFCTSRDGVRIAYAVCGDGPPLVWSPHWVRHLKFDWVRPVWRPWMKLLTRRHTVIRYDWRGCGLSDREGVEFDLQRHFEDFEAVIDAVGFERFVLSAWAMERELYGVCRPLSSTGQPSGSDRGVAGGRVALGQTPEEAAEEETSLNAIDSVADR